MSYTPAHTIQFCFICPISLSMAYTVTKTLMITVWSKTIAIEYIKGSRWCFSCFVNKDHLVFRVSLCFFCKKKLYRRCFHTFLVHAIGRPLSCNLKMNEDTTDKSAQGNRRRCSDVMTCGSSSRASMLAHVQVWLPTSLLPERTFPIVTECKKAGVLDNNAI